MRHSRVEDIEVHLACECGNRDSTIAPLRSLPPCSAECGRKMYVVAGPQRDLRDYFAGQAVTGLLHHYHEERGISPNPFDTLAEYAYRYADAMLAVREKGGG